MLEMVHLNRMMVYYARLGMTIVIDFSFVASLVRQLMILVVLGLVGCTYVTSSMTNTLVNSPRGLHYLCPPRLYARRGTAVWAEVQAAYHIHGSRRSRGTNVTLFDAKKVRYLAARKEQDRTRIRTLETGRHQGGNRTATAMDAVVRIRVGNQDSTARYTAHQSLIASCIGAPRAG